MSDLSMRERAGETAADLLDEDEVAVVLAEIRAGQFGRAVRTAPGPRRQRRHHGAAHGRRRRRVRDGGIPDDRAHDHAVPGRAAAEQIKLDFGYQGLQGTFVSVGGAYDYTSEGFTHHAPGDVQVMLTVPGMQVVVPGTPDELERLFRATYANGDITYLRPSTATNAVSRAVEVGRLDVVRRGSRATVAAVGPMLDRTLGRRRGDGRHGALRDQRGAVRRGRPRT